MTLEKNTVSAQELEKKGEDLGYQYSHLSPHDTASRGGDVVLDGTIRLQALPCGAKICASDVTYLKGAEHVGELPRSFTIVHILDGVATDCELGSGNRLHVSAGCTATVSVADSAQLSEHCTAGQRSRSILVHSRPEDLADEQLADRMNAAIKSTGLAPMTVSTRSSALARELFAPSLDGDVGRLLAESCALELLARSLANVHQNGHDRTPVLSRQERARILKVQDLLIAEPGRPYRLCDLAREAGVGVTTLKTKFPLVTGKPVFEFLRDVRLERAHAGLESEGWTVAQAAHFVGYTHQSNFSTAFRRKFGVSPSSIRRRD